MSIKTDCRAAPAPLKPLFPVLREYKDPASITKYGPLIVLFTNYEEGVALSGVGPERIGKPESWVVYDDTKWQSCIITLTTEN